jgi:quercetin dioxygenase-like cupin family protein
VVTKYSTARTTHPISGVVRKILANSPNLMLVEHTLEKGAVLPDHKHPHEQLVYLLSGEIQLELNGDSIVMSAGDSLLIPPNINHKVETFKKSVALDIFTPRREDF